MEGMKFNSFNGEVEMRKNDHQLQQGLFISKWEKAGGEYPLDSEGHRPHLRAREVLRALRGQHRHVVPDEAPLSSGRFALRGPTYSGLFLPSIQKFLMNLEFFVISLLNGVSYGLLLFMLSSGLTLIFSMMGVLELCAHQLLHAGCLLCVHHLRGRGFLAGAGLGAAGRVCAGCRRSSATACAGCTSSATCPSCWSPLACRT